MIRAMVLAAGFGTRLRPLTLELPKPLVPIGDGSLLRQWVDRLRQAGVGEIVVNAHHLADAVEREVASLGAGLTCSQEEGILGTAGGIHRVTRGEGRPLLVCNGDVAVEVPFSALLGALPGASAVFAVAPRGAGQGSVGVGPEGEVVRLRAWRGGTEVRGGDYVGVAALGTTCLAALPEVGCLVGDWAVPALARGEVIRTVEVPGPWTDVGTPSAYLDANVAWLERRGLRRWLGPGAFVAPGVALGRCVIGAGARVEGAGLLDDVVVWPGAVARAPLLRAIQARQHLVRLDAGEATGR